MNVLRRLFAIPDDGCPWRIAPAWWMTAAMLIATVQTLCLVVLVFGVYLRNRLPVLVTDGVAGGTMLAVMLGMLYLLPGRGKLADKLGIRKFRERDLRIVLVGIAAVYAWEFSVTPLWEMLLRALNITWKENQALLELCASGSWRRFVVMLVLVGILTPVMEEVLFRRLLYSLLRPLGIWNGLILTSLVFAAVHFFLHGFPALAGIGAVFQWIYLRSGNLAASILTHMTFNFIALSVAFFIGV